MSYASVSTVQEKALSEAASYKSPQFVDKLDDKFKWDKGSTETIDEIESKNQNYYDGSRSLHYLKEICKQFNRLQNLCSKQESCGWCYSTNTCIHGTAQGPVEQCAVRHFYYKEKLI